jgi:hypothetical protein
MRVIDLRLWFIGLTIVVFIGISYLNARWLRTDYDDMARIFSQEMLHIEDVSARAPSPRVIFAGGSSVLYAVDPKAIERNLGIHVVNMGMPSRIGSDANYFDYLLPHIRKGDIVFYTNQRWFGKLTQEAEANEAREARRLADRLWEFAKIDLTERHYNDWPLLVPFPDASIFNRLTARARVDHVSSIYQRDDHGGIVQCPMKLVSFKPYDPPPAALDHKVIKRSAEFVREAESRGAHVIFFETPMLIVASQREKWSRHRKELRSQLAQVAPVLDATDTHVFSADIDRFCDGKTHVDDDVRAEWSQSLSAQLRQLPAVLALGRTGAGAAPLQLRDAYKLKHPRAD